MSNPNERSILEPTARQLIFYVFYFLVFVGMGCYFATTQLRPEWLMSENKVLSEAFSQRYLGSQFTALRSICWTQVGMAGRERQAWEYTYHDPNWKVDIEDGYKESDNPCLVDSTRKTKFVIKSEGGSSYAVFTSGEEKEQPYTPELVKKLLRAVEISQLEVENKKAIDASWIEHKKAVDASWSNTKSNDAPK